MRLGLGLGVNKGRRKMGTVAEGVIASLESQAASDGYTAFSGDVKDASLVMVTSLVEAGVWDKADLFAMYATNGDRDFASYNWVDPTVNYGTQFNTPTFTSLQGFTGNGSNMYISHGDVQDKSSRNDVSIGYFQRSSSAGQLALNNIGSQAASVLSIGSLGDGTGYYRINASGPSTVGPVGQVNVLLIADRSGASSDALYSNGSSAGTSTTASTTDQIPVDVLRRVSNYSTEQISFVWKGQSLTPTEHSALYSAISAYLTTIGSI